MNDLLEGFEAWWEAHGQYCRAGGGEYEKTFAFRAWEAATASECERICTAIKAEDVGLQADICTRQVLREVCENCRCKHAPKGPNAEVRGASRLAGEASSAEGATSTDVLCREGETR